MLTTYTSNTTMVPSMEPRKTDILSNTSFHGCSSAMSMVPEQLRMLKSQGIKHQPKYKDWRARLEGEGSEKEDAEGGFGGRDLRFNGAKKGGGVCFRRGIESKTQSLA